MLSFYFGNCRIHFTVGSTTPQHDFATSGSYNAKSRA